MAIERFEDINNCSLYSVSHKAFEYGPTIKWLISKTSDVHHMPPEDIWLNNKGIDDHSEWMDQEKDDIYLEEIEEDDIEDW